MATNVIGVGQSALAAAQAGLVTTGHNIANASTPGYSRQVVIQGPAGAQDMGFGFVGKGTEVLGIQRVFSEFTYSRVLSSQTTAASSTAYSTRIDQIDRMLSDADSGVGPAIQDFFKGIQDLTANPSLAESRQAALSSGEALASRLNSLDSRLNEMRDNVNQEISSSISQINSYADQIAALNKAIEKAEGTAGDGKPANDLRDQRDQLIVELSKQTKVTTVKQGSAYNVFIGNGSPMVVGEQSYKLVVAPADPANPTLGTGATTGTTTIVPDNALPGGTLGGLLDFRKNSLDTAQNTLGRIAIGLGMAFNAQHQLGVDANGNPGKNFFNVQVTSQAVAGAGNTSTAKLDATVVDATKLTTSDYRIERLPDSGGTSNYRITRIADGAILPSNASLPSLPQTVDGVTFALSGSPATPMNVGDYFVAKPTSAGAGTISLNLTDISQIAAAAPYTAAADPANAGSGKLGPLAVKSLGGMTLPLTLTYNAGTQTLDSTGSPAVSIPVTNGSTGTVAGVSFTFSGSPANGDKFYIKDTFDLANNVNGSGDNRNAMQLAQLQLSNTLGDTGGGATLSFQTAYGQLVSQVGAKASEMKVMAKSDTAVLTQAQEAHQSESGVNLDEEASNLMRYQQAYQAASKVMQTANQLFQMLLQLGG
ncbi:flagellar hook-associated protein 1 FlgK [Noviherbaspirillum humi]|uniref:Flagellar hook-associated protein 1 n=1 Tax=Noviherbaspirillum humi TaxID=1688639 RepID=A0A239FZG0_9BURK|nr:flagellar hook-associated protein FlgK [Noviherbaspirillum humi]SNS61154.1 flagellar hook-associated protein 1 FlgK [Noviherbaspirillum humi]